MKHRHRQKPSRSGLDLVEEATQMLRAAPVAALTSYYVGSLPFVFGLLYFWADMSRNPYARDHVVEYSLGLSLLYLWMKFWQAIFARQIHAHVAATPPPPWNAGRLIRIFVTQSMLQPWGLFALPLSALTILPFPAVFAFFQNLTVLDETELPSTGSMVKKSRQLATLWPGQNTLALLLLLSFGLIVWLNWLTVCYLLPQLLHTFLGIETDMARGGSAFLNSTFLSAMYALTYLSVDPILKTVYVLRCFYGESLKSGEDLKTRLKRSGLSVVGAVTALLLAASLFATLPARGADAPTPPASATPATIPAAAPSVAPDDLDQTIQNVIQQKKYVWRIPRTKAEEEEAQPGVIAQFFQQIQDMLRDALRGIGDWLGKVWRGLFPEGSDRENSPRASLFSAVSASQILIFVLIVLVVCTLAILLFRLWRNRRLKTPLSPATALPVTPDLTDENVSAEQLPEDGWTTLGEQLFQKGDYRLALRAFYLAGLAHLASRSLISLAKFKSNRDYQRELGRRSHALPQLPVTFGATVSIFEQVWYGLHEANGDLVTRFRLQVQNLRASE